MFYRDNILIGSTKENRLVFMDVRIYNDHTFTASFSIVTPFSADSIDWDNFFYDFVESHDKSTLYDMCAEYDCSPNDLVSVLANKEHYDIDEWFDCSLFSDIFYINGSYWYFESYACGQIDIEDSMSDYVNESLCKELIGVWKNNHLREIDDVTIEYVEKLVDNIINAVDQEEYIIDLIKSLDK